MRRVGRERQLHLKVRALCGEVEKVFDVLVDTGAQVSLVKAGLLPPECLTDSRKPVSLKVANGQYMVGRTKEAAIGLQFVNHRELSRPDLGKEILLQGRFYEVVGVARSSPVPMMGIPSCRGCWITCPARTSQLAGTHPPTAIYSEATPEMALWAT